MLGNIFLLINPPCTLGVFLTKKISQFTKGVVSESSRLEPNQDPICESHYSQLLNLFIENRSHLLGASI
jgi:hypothetical protein